MLLADHPHLQLACVGNVTVSSILTAPHPPPPPTINARATVGSLARASFAAALAPSQTNYPFWYVHCDPRF